MARHNFKEEFKIIEFDCLIFKISNYGYIYIYRNQESFNNNIVETYFEYNRENGLFEYLETETYDSYITIKQIENYHKALLEHKIEDI